MSRRATTSDIRHARVVRPDRVEDDTDENEPQRPPSVQRTKTPVHQQFARILERLDDSLLPPEFKIALEAIGERLDAQVVSERRERDRLHSEIERISDQRTRWARFLSLAKGISISAAVGGLLTASAALIHRGETVEVNRRNIERLDKLGAIVERISDDLASVRAQAATNRDILLRSRMSAPNPSSQGTAP